MQARFIEFGEIELEGKRYEQDVVVDGGKVRRRRKSSSKVFRDRYGHTPLSVAEEIPWSGRRLIVGTGVNGSLPIMPEVYGEAERRGVEIVAVPLEEALRLVKGTEEKDVFAVLHVTC